MSEEGTQILEILYRLDYIGSDQFIVSKYCLRVARELCEAKMKDSSIDVTYETLSGAANCSRVLFDLSRLSLPRSLVFTPRQHYYVQIVCSDGTYSTQCDGELFWLCLSSVEISSLVWSTVPVWMEDGDILNLI